MHLELIKVNQHDVLKRPGVLPVRSQKRGTDALGDPVMYKAFDRLVAMYGTQVELDGRAPLITTRV